MRKHHSNEHAADVDKNPPKNRISVHAQEEQSWKLAFRGDGG